MTGFYPTSFSYCWVKNGHDRKLPRQGQKPLVEIPDTTEAIFKLFYSDNNALHFEYYIK